MLNRIRILSNCLLRLRSRLLVLCLAMFALAVDTNAEGLHLGNPQVPQGGSGTFPSTGFDMPSNRQQWDIVGPTGIVATTSSPNGWNVTYMVNSFTVSAPLSATVAAGYEVRASLTGQGEMALGSPPPYVSAYFDVDAAGSEPAAPTGLTATPGINQVTLQWNPSVGANTYTVYIGSTPTGSYSAVSPSGLTGTSWTDTGLQNGTTYYFVVTATNANGTSPYSSWVSCKPGTGPPAPPAGLTAAAGDQLVVLNWQPPSGATSYTVYRGLVSGGPYKQVSPNGYANTTYTDTGLVDGTTYYYVVTASNAYGESGYSNEASATPVPQPPAAPTLQSAVPANQSVTLYWSTVAGQVTYTAYYSPTSGGPYTSFATNIQGTSATKTNLLNGTTYYFVVTAQSSVGPSGYSNELSATPANWQYPINIVPNPPLGFLPNSMTVPGWMGSTEPVDGSEAGIGPSGAISVNLAYGVANFNSGPDLVIANPLGPDISFSRTYRTAMSAGNLSSPGLPPGWTHNWDFWMIPTATGIWSDIQIVYPNGSSEAITPIFDGNGNPTGAFQVPPGAPYSVTGIPSTTVVGNWFQITLTHNGLSQEVFTPSGDGKYRIISMVFGNGSQLNYHYSGLRGMTSPVLASIDNAPGGGSATPLLQLNYNGQTLASITDPATGNTRNFGYASGELITATFIGSSFAEWSYSYSTLGNANYLHTATSYDAQSRTTGATINYDANTGRVQSTTDLTNNTRTYSYPTPGAGSVAIGNSVSGQQTDSFKETADLLGRTATTTTAAGDVTSYQYSSSNLALPTTVVRPLGNALSVITDSHGNPTKVVYPYGTATQVTWIYQLISPQGTTIQFPLGLVTGVAEVDNGGVANPPTTYNYYNGTGGGGVLGYVSSITYPNGGTVSFTYTAMGNLATVTDTTGTTTYGYTTNNLNNKELFGRPYWVTDPKNKTTYFQYDSAGRLIQTTDPTNVSASLQYNQYNQVTNLTLPMGLSAQINYGQIGKPSLSTILSNGTTQLTLQQNTYDSQSQLIASSDANSLSNNLTLDGESDLTKVVNGNGDPLHQFGYLPWNRALQTMFGSGRNGLTVSASFSKVGNLTSTASSDNRTSTVAYMPVDPDTPFQVNASDPATGWNNEIDAYFDSFGRHSNMDSMAADGVSNVWHAYTYDHEDNVLTDGFLTLSPGLGLIGTSSGSSGLSYSYNPDGTRSQMIVTLSGDTTLSNVTYNYLYDAAKRVTSIGVFQGIASPGTTSGATLGYASYTYDDDGRVVAVRATNATTFYTYNALGQVTQLLNVTPDGSIDPYAPAQVRVADPYIPGLIHTTLACFYNITYDMLGDRTGMSFSYLAGQSLSSLSSTYASGTTTWSYDPGGRLTGETWTNSLPQNSRVSYVHGYDRGGNLTTIRGNSLTVDPLSDMLTGNSIPGYGTISYDATGEIKQFDGNTAAFNPFGQLTTVSGYCPNISTGGSSSFSASMIYDHLGRRAAIAQSLGAGSIGMGVRAPNRSAAQPPAGSTKDVQFFIYDGEDLVYRQLASPQTALNYSDLGPAPEVLYLYGPTGLVMEFNPDNTLKSTFLFDPQGSCVASADGRPNTSYFVGYSYNPTFYDSYGSLVWTPINNWPTQPEQSIASAQPFQYKGQYGYYTDGTTGLIYCHNRYYDPQTARWTSRDPSGLDGGVNVYAYCDGDPVGLIDTDGLQVQNQFGVQGLAADLLGLGRGSSTDSENIGNAFHKTLMATHSPHPVLSLYLDSYRTCHSTGVAYAANLGWTVFDILQFGIPVESKAAKAALGAAELAEITGRLEELTGQALKTARLTVRQSRAVARRPYKYNAYFGERVDTALKELVVVDPILNRYGLITTRRFQFGPDFFLPGGQYWWDLTKPPLWENHTKLYSPIFGPHGILVGY